MRKFLLMVIAVVAVAGIALPAAAQYSGGYGRAGHLNGVHRRIDYRVKHRGYNHRVNYGRAHRRNLNQRLHRRYNQHVRRVLRRVDRSVYRRGTVVRGSRRRGYIIRGPVRRGFVNRGSARRYAPRNIRSHRNYKRHGFGLRRGYRNY